MFDTSRDFSKDFFASLMTWANEMSPLFLIVFKVFYIIIDFGDFCLIFFSDVQII